MLTIYKKYNLPVNFLLVSGFLFLLSEILAGPIRYYAYSSGVILFIYLPKVLLTISMFLFISTKLFKGKLSKACIIFLFFVFFSLLIAFLNIRDISQIAFGVWLLIPFTFGILSAPIIFNNSETLRKYILCLWLIATIGVFINLFYKWPWSGFSYEIGNIAIEGTRKWFAGGFERLPGFSRISAATASQILLTGIMLIFYFKNLFLKISIWLLSGIAIFFTTTKTTLATWLILTFLFIFSNFFSLKLFKLLPILLVLVIIVLPFSTLFINYKLSLDSFMRHLLLASFEERLTLTWPWTINMVLKHGSVILGRGIGGIGASQRYFENQLYSPADNLTLYLFGIFGIVGVILLMIVGILISLQINTSKYDKFVLFLSIVCFLEGFTLSVIEEPCSAICLGIVFYFAFSRVRGSNKFRMVQ